MDKKHTTQKSKAEGGNLTSFSKQGEGRKRASDAGKKGAPKTHEIMRKRRAMREAINDLLERPIPQSQSKLVADAAQALGLPPEQVTIQDAAILAQAVRAMKGDVKALEFLRDTVGEKPVDRLEIDESIPEPLAPVKDGD